MLQRLRGLGRNLILLAVSCLLVLAAAELAMRARGDLLLKPGEQIWIGRIYDETDPPMGYSPLPHARQTIVSGGDYVVTFEINSAGLRDVEHPLAKDPRRRRILVLGDSFMFGQGVQMEEAMPRQLEKAMTGVEAINAGVVGYELGQEYLFYKERQWRWQADLVLLAFFLNDLPGNSELEITWSADGLPLSYQRSAEALSKKDAESPRGIAGAASAWLRSHSLLYMLARKRLDTLALARPRPPAAPQDPEGIATAPWLTALRAHPDGAAAVQWERTYRLLDALADLVRSHGARLAVMVIPAPIQASEHAWRSWSASMPDDAAFDRRKPEEMVQAWCARTATPCLDLLEAFERQDPTLVFLKHDRHWTAQGHLVAARAAGEFLASHHLP